MMFRQSFRTKLASIYGVIRIPANAHRATIANPVHVIASASETVPVAQVQVWDNGAKLGWYPGSSVDQTYTLPLGSHTTTVIDLDASNNVLHSAKVTYDELLASADPTIAAQIDEEVFVRKFDCIQQGLNELQETFAQVNPDVVVMFGDDQDELFFEDNYPMISVYWGDILTHYPRMTTRPGMSEAIRISSSVYGTEIIDYPVETKSPPCVTDVDTLNTRTL